MALSALDAIDAGKIRVETAMKFFVDVLFRLRPVEMKGLGTIAIDAGLRLYYDPDAVTAWIANGPERMARPIFHEIDHWLRKHFDRCGDRDKRRFNCSSDREINGDQEPIADKLHWPWPAGLSPLMPEQIGMPRNLSAEEYYEHEPEPSASTALGAGACGGCAGNPMPHEIDDDAGGSTKKDKPDPVSEGEAEIIRERVAQKIHEAMTRGDGRGNIPAGLARWAEERLAPPKVDYKRLLAKVVRGTVESVAGQFDYTRRRVGRRYMAFKHAFGKAPIPPAMNRPRPRVVVVSDTSGSMGEFTPDSPLYRAGCETIGIAKSAGAEVTVLGGDTEFTEGKVRSAKDLAKVFVGGGGTDMRVGILEAAALKPKPDIIFVVTDCLTGWPSKDEMPRGITVVVVAIGDETPPEYIRHVKVDLS